MSEKLKIFHINCKVYLLENIRLNDVLQEVTHVVDEALCKDEDMTLLHTQNQFKNYVVSGFCEIEKDKIYKEGGLYNFVIRCTDEALARYFTQMIPKTDTVKMKGLTAEYKYIPQRYISKLYSITPVVISTDDNLYWRGNIDVQKYEELLFTNAIKKFNAIQNEKCDENFRLYDSMTFTNKIPMGTRYKNITLLGDKLELHISSDQRAQDMAYMLLGTGLGRLNARAFGFVNYRSE